jgi:hypothetical protein
VIYLLRLTQEERDQILETLTLEQQEFLKERLKRGKKTAFARVMAISKGMSLPDHATDEEIQSIVLDWVLIDYIDSGFINPETRCDCGKPLRYQYIVQNTRTQEIRKFGINHLELHTGIDAETVKAIRKSWDAIDLELDEILVKIRTKWSLEGNKIYIPDDLTLPKDIQEHLDLQLPLLERQITRLLRLIKEYHEEKLREKILQEIEPVVDQNEALKEIERSASREIKFHKPSVYDHQFDLFSDFIEKISENGDLYIERENTFFHESLAQEHKREIDLLIEAGIRSARIVCERLMDSFPELHRGRYITGKPKIYTSVCSYLDSMVTRGKLLLVYKDHSDRVYERKDL